MNTYIALFRGINVGGNNILPMKALVTILESLGCQNVKTYIQSGNVAFRHPEGQKNVLKENIGNAIDTRHGFKPHILLLDQTEFKNAVTQNPYPVDDGKALHVFFLATKAENPDLNALEALKTPTESFTLTQSCFYLHAPDGIGRSKLATKVEKTLGVPATARNWNTVDKLNTMIATI